MGDLTAPSGSVAADTAAAALPALEAGIADVAAITTAALPPLRATRMRRSPTAYSISLRPVSSSSAARARTSSLSIFNSLLPAMGFWPTHPHHQDKAGL